MGRGLSAWAWIRGVETTLLTFQLQFLTIQLYVTRPKDDMLVSPCPNVPAYAGRPEWRSLFNRFVEQRLGTIGVTVCGPGTLSDSIRYAVREQISNASIDFLEESFTW